MSHYNNSKKCTYCSNPIWLGSCYTQGCPGEQRRLPPTDANEMMIHAIRERCWHTTMKHEGVAECATDGGAESANDLALDILAILGVTPNITTVKPLTKPVQPLTPYASGVIPTLNKENK